jgi:hypothetical protein
LKNSTQGYDIDTIQKVLFEKAKKEQEAATKQAPAQVPSQVPTQPAGEINQ